MEVYRRRWRFIAGSREPRGCDGEHLLDVHRFGSNICHLTQSERNLLELASNCFKDLYKR